MVFVCRKNCIGQDGVCDMGVSWGGAFGDNVFNFLREARPVGLVVVGVGFLLLDVLKFGLGIYGSGDWEVV